MSEAYNIDAVDLATADEPIHTIHVIVKCNCLRRSQKGGRKRVRGRKRWEIGGTHLEIAGLELTHVVGPIRHSKTSYKSTKMTKDVM